MQWLTVAWWRWRLAHARGRNPLVRTTDRIEVAAMAVAVVVSLAVIPFAAAIGTAVHDEHARMYAAQQHDRHRTTDTVAADATAGPRAPVAVVRARWRAGDVENAGTFPSDTAVKDGSDVHIWVDNSGRQVSPPAPSWQAGVDAVVAASGLWLGVTAAAALLIGFMRWGLRHARYSAWNREIAGLVHDDNGRTNRRR